MNINQNIETHFRFKQTKQEPNSHHHHHHHMHRKTFALVTKSWDFECVFVSSWTQIISVQNDKKGSKSIKRKGRKISPLSFCRRRHSLFLWGFCLIPKREEICFFRFWGISTFCADFLGKVYSFFFFFWINPFKILETRGQNKLYSCGVVTCDHLINGLDLVGLRGPSP